MTREEALAKLISARHYCYLRGILGRPIRYTSITPPEKRLPVTPELEIFLEDCDGHADESFHQAFRDLTRLYVEVRDGLNETLKPGSGIGRRRLAKRKVEARGLAMTEPH